MSNRVIKQMDEMEKDIALRSMRCGFLFTTLALVIWGGISINFETGADWQIPIYILCIQNIIVFVSRQIYRKKVEDDRWKKDTAGPNTDETQVICYINL